MERRSNLLYKKDDQCLEVIKIGFLKSASIFVYYKDVKLTRIKNKNAKKVLQISLKPRSTIKKFN